MQIVSVVFGKPVYHRLARVWEWSTRRHHPDATVKLVDVGGETQDHQSNNEYKLTKWARIVEETDDDLILMDSDMLVLGDISHVFEQEFDVCYTKRTRSGMPLNGGVLFVRPYNPGVREMFRDWLKVDAGVRRGKYKEYKKWITKYGGQNQASFGYMLDKCLLNIRVAHVPCTSYNCCQEEWRFVDDSTRVIHVKSSLRKSVQRGSTQARRKLQKALSLWYEAENQMLAETHGGSDSYGG